MSKQPDLELSLHLISKAALSKGDLTQVKTMSFYSVSTLLFQNGIIVFGQFSNVNLVFPKTASAVTTTTARIKGGGL